jgi:NAD(P)-dependent dehydrogenase (short-subunit alcohol dehydrogenase family)
MNDLFRLDGKAAVVTGGGRGIGAACVRQLDAAGARVAVLDLEPGSGAGLRIACDVADEGALEAALGRAAGELGGIDVLVNNAGRAIRKPALEITRAEWQSVIDLNLTALFLGSRIAARHMKQRGGGAIVNLASIMGLSGGIFPNASYQASKGAVVNLTRALALEWASDRIRVNAVAPTFVRTDLTAPVFSNPQLLEAVMAHSPLGVLPEPDDIAAAVLYLAAPAARCVTGVVLPVDSGYLAR